MNCSSVNKEFKLIIEDPSLLKKIGYPNALYATAEIQYSWTPPEVHECDYGATIFVHNLSVFNGKQNGWEDDIEDDAYDSLKEIAESIHFSAIDDLNDEGDEIAL